jgi:hypothetical protein
MSYGFRIRFHLPDEYRIGIDEPELIIGNYQGSDIVLKSKLADTPINKSHTLILRGDNYISEEEARNAGLHCRDVLMLAFAQNHIGADFGDRAPLSAFTNAGLEMLKGKMGVHVLNDVHGLMTFKNEPQIKFAVFHAEPVVTRNKERFIETIKRAFEYNSDLSDQQRLAFDIFGTAFFQKSIDARFLMLMVAFETLLVQDMRSKEVQKHIKELIHLTDASSAISRDEKNSLIGSLQSLNKESIGQAGRKLVECLGDHTYSGQKPDAFFTSCYEIRSRLVHGSVPRPTRDDIANICISLESLVGDLISYQIIT